MADESQYKILQSYYNRDELLRYIIPSDIKFLQQ